MSSTNTDVADNDVAQVIIHDSWFMMLCIYLSHTREQQTAINPQDIQWVLPTSVLSTPPSCLVYKTANLIVQTIQQILPASSASAGSPSKVKGRTMSFTNTDVADNDVAPMAVHRRHVIIPNISICWRHRSPLDLRKWSSWCWWCWGNLLYSLNNQVGGCLLYTSPSPRD